MSEQILSETISIEKITGKVKGGLLNLKWNVIKRINDIQHYSVYNPLMSPEEGAVIDDVHILFPEKQIGIIIPFTENEKICWECGAQRMLEIRIDECGCTTWFDWCYNPQYKRIKK